MIIAHIFFSIYLTGKGVGKYFCESRNIPEPFSQTKRIPLDYMAQWFIISLTPWPSGLAESVQIFLGHSGLSCCRHVFGKQYIEDSQCPFLFKCPRIWDTSRSETMRLLSLISDEPMIFDYSQMVVPVRSPTLYISHCEETQGDTKSAILAFIMERSASFVRITR